MQNQSMTQLDSADYKVVSTGLRGEASLSYLFWFIPLGNPALATQAVSQVVQSADLDGKPRALINFAYDEVNGTYPFFSTTTVKVRADVVEFNR